MFRVTRDTTDEEIYAAYNKARETLVKAADKDRYNSEILAEGLNALATAEGEARARATYREALIGMLDLDHSEEEATAYAKEAMTSLLLNGVNDTWSGRKNDVRRAFHDGLVSAAGELIRGY